MPDRSRELKAHAPATSPGPETADKAKTLLDMRHELRTPMHVVKGLTSILAASEPLTARQKEIVALLKSNADRLFVLIDKMLDFFQVVIGEKTTGPGLTEKTSCQTPRMALDKNQRILLVEDYGPNTVVATSFLRKMGYDYDVAESGKQALNKFSTHRYGAVIMDIQLPGMDGLETTRRMRALEKQKNLPPTYILATTGNATEEDRMFCLKAGMNDHLSKPFLLEELEEKLSTGSLG